MTQCCYSELIFLPDLQTHPSDSTHPVPVNTRAASELTTA